MSEQKRPLWGITGIYVLLGIAGYLSYKFVPVQNEILRFFIADIVMTVVCFSFSLYKRNTSVYDAYWSVIPFYFVLLWWTNTRQAWGIAEYSTALVISLWSWRLTYNWYRGWQGWQHEDWRFVNFRKQFGKNYNWFNFFSLHLIPTCIVFLGCTGLFYLYNGTTKDLNTLIIAGNVVAFTGFLFEFFADNTLHKSRSNPTRQKGTTIREGIWAYSRNPNYLGEMLFWVGIALIGFGAMAPWWCGLGATAIIAMFVFATIPMKEKRLSETRTDFEKYKAEVSRIIPMPRS